MRKLMSAFLCVALAGCSSKTILPEPASSELGNGDVSVLVDDITFEDGTKTEASVDETSGLSFTWSKDDKVGVYTSEGGMALFNLTAGEGTAEAVFNGSGFSLTEGKTYYALYPYNGGATDMTKLNLDYSTRKISSQNNLEDLTAFDYLKAVAVADAESHARFSFNHLSSFIRLKLNISKTETIKSIDIIPTYGSVADAVSYDLSSDVSTVVSEKNVKNIPVEDISTDELTAWLPMIPQNFSDAALVVNTASGNRYTTRMEGKELHAGKASRRNLEAPSFPMTVSPGVSLSTKALNTLNSAPSGQYSGITKITDTRYAVVHDKKNGGGIVFFDMTIGKNGYISSFKYDIPEGTGESTTSRDPEGIVYVPSSNTLFVSGEADQQILEYDMNGRPTGRKLNIPDDMTAKSISGNYGFESLGYNSNTGLFWTTTENALPKDKSYQIDGRLMIRLQSFSDKTLDAGKRYFYLLDKASYEPKSGDTYAFGVPDILALDDGRLIIIEREAIVPTTKYDSRTIVKFYIVDPVDDKGGILNKTLLHTISTSILGWANYEGLCLGPELSGKKTVLTVNDSQDRYNGVLLDYLTVLEF